MENDKLVPSPNAGRVAADVAQLKKDLAWLDQQIARLEGQARDGSKN